MGSFFRDPLMWDPFRDSSFRDPFEAFANDPFFSGGLSRPITNRGQQQGLLRDTDFSKDNTSLTTTGNTGTNVGTVGNVGGQNDNVGFWNFNRFLNEPITLDLEDKEDRYIMNVRKPSHLGNHDLKIDLKNDVLTVHGDKKEERNEEDKDKGAKSYYYSSSSFSRSTRLPPNVDQSKIAAHIDDNGTLKIDLPKVVETKKAKDLKQIPINKRT